MMNKKISEPKTPEQVAVQLFEEPKESTKSFQLEQDVRDIKKDVATNTTNIAVIQNNVTVIQRDVASNTSDIAEVKEKVYENNSGINRILGLLEGEEKASKKESERRDTVKTWIAGIGIAVSLILGIIANFT